VADNPHAVGLVDAYTRASAAQRRTVLALVLAEWARLTSWRDGDASRLAAAAAPRVAAGQVAAARLTSAYLARVLSALLGGHRPSSTVDVGYPRVVDPQVVYRRPVEQVWRSLADGASLLDAVDAGRRRLESLVVTDLQLARTHAARDVIAVEPRVVGFRRVLTGDGSCGLCVVASTQRYHQDGLLPIHPACDCAVAPLVGDVDPGRVIDQELLDAAHDAVAERFGAASLSARGSGVPDYRTVLLVREHGELGPVLTVASHEFTGPADLPDA
jgi:hypothetical protein